MNGHKLLDTNILFYLSKKELEIRKKYKIKLPDAIIAATAVEKDLVLVTRNTNDFKLKGLKINITNPFKNTNH